GNPDRLAILVDVDRARRSPGAAGGQLEVILDGIELIRRVVGRLDVLRDHRRNHQRGGEHVPCISHEDSFMTDVSGAARLKRISRRAKALAERRERIIRYAPMRQLAFAAAVLALGVVAAGDDGDRVLTIDHYVRVKSSVPAIAGQEVPIYARERVLAGAALRGGVGDRVALFVHGAGTPAEVAFDVPQPEYSWMAFLARAGFDTFAMDTTGYGRSFRPAAMNDPCNLAKDRQAPFVKGPCASAYGHALTTIASDWNDIDGVVDYIRALRRVDRVSLLGWSLGGPRAGGYAAQHPEKVQKLVLLAPAYNRGAAAAPPAKMPPEGVPMNTQSRQEFYTNSHPHAACPPQS